ncbi:MAG: nucleotide exchange factor GrpE [Minisyncoccus archaeiphilus]|uniref:nucleotide exchange factor GrpE n=1 Tax=Minisyncoccus archaeiphilus TaxID=3238481 RepID=UPI0009D2AFD3|nr:MAG: heat shock protein GrpE [Parcubacteria group bacterium ADurb.Bin216]GMX59741.1 MAG: nucleotide exchange factor GrpE [Candidatus Parcubacteria bacterium]
MKKEKSDQKDKKNLDKKIIEDMQLLIEDLENKNKEIFAGWQRTEADFLNYKNKESERLQELSFHIKEGILEELIPVLDNFDLAERCIPGDKKEDCNIKGLLIIKKQLGFFLKSMNIEEIPSVGQLFNPLYHEVIEEVETEEESGTVVDEIQKGYLLNGKVIRPAKVRVAK